MTRARAALPALRRLIIAALVLAGFGCGGEGDDPEIDPPLAATTEDNVLNNLQVAWRKRDIDGYARLLADDFRYFPDPGTRNDLGAESWDRAAELEDVGCLFNSADVRKVTIQLGWRARSAAPAGLTGPRASWTRLFVTDNFADVDYMPPGEEVNTYRVEDQTQRLFFRRGRTHPASGPGDTLIYIVEWRDDGRPSGKPSAPVPIYQTSWSRLKLLAGGCE